MIQQHHLSTEIPTSGRVRAIGLLDDASHPGAKPVTGSCVTAQVADYVSRIRYEDLPPDVIVWAKWLVADNVACAIAGGQTGIAASFLEYQESHGGRPTAAVLGRSTRLPAPQAADVNAYAATLLSFDDSLVRLGHPGTSVIPGAIAVAEELDRPGSELLVAIIAGYEVSLRLGTAIRPSPERAATVLGLATWQIYGAASAVARLHRLSPAATRDVFGLTAQHAPVPFLRKFHGRPMPWLKNNYGWATMGAVTAGSLAARGFAGSRDIFDGETGFWRMAGSDQYDSAEMTRALGSEFRLMQVGCKPYGCCRWVHPALDVLRTLAAEQPIEPAKVTRIEVATFGEIVRDFAGKWPDTIIEAQFHLPLLIALELLGRSSANGLVESALEEPQARELAAKVSLSLLSGADDAFFGRSLLPFRLKVMLTDGSIREGYAEIPGGAPGGPPFGPDEIARKFHVLVEPTLGSPQSERLLDAVLDIETTSAREIAALAQPSRRESIRAKEGRSDER